MASHCQPLPYPKMRSHPTSRPKRRLHHGKHHAAYVEHLNELVEADASLSGKGLDDLVRTPRAPSSTRQRKLGTTRFYCAACARRGGEPSGAIRRGARAMRRSFAASKEVLGRGRAISGSGWALAGAHGDRLEILDTTTRANPLTQSKTPP